MRRWLTAGGGGAAWILLSSAVVLAVMALGARTGPFTLLLPGIGLDARGGPGLRFAPLTPGLIADVLGGAAAAALLGPDARPPAPPAGQAAPAPEPRRHGTGGLPTPEELTREPRIVIEMDVDRASAGRGDTLTYSITVTNAGSGTAKEIRVTSHVPEHTTLVAGAECGGQNVSVTPNPSAPGGYTVCVSVPGAPAPGEHGIQIGFGPLNPGRQETFVFTVAIDADAPRGAIIRNHAHVDGPDLPRRTSNEVTTRVL